LQELRQPTYENFEKLIWSRTAHKADLLFNVQASEPTLLGRTSACKFTSQRIRSKLGFCGRGINRIILRSKKVHARHSYSSDVAASTSGLRNLAPRNRSLTNTCRERGVKTSHTDSNKLLNAACEADVGVAGESVGTDGILCAPCCGQST